MLENEYDKHGTKFLFKESSTEFGKSKNLSDAKKRFDKNKKNKSSHYRSQGLYRKKIKEEIGRSFSTVDNNPIQQEKVLSDLRIEIYPIGQMFMASVKNKTGEKVSKIFRDEEQAQVWVRNKSLELSNKFTQ